MASPARSTRGLPERNARAQLDLAMRSTQPRSNAATSSLSRSALRSRRSNFSYKELSSDNESEEVVSDESTSVANSIANSQSQPREVLPTRQSLALRSSTPRAHWAQRQRRTTSRNVHYAEDSSNDDFDEEHDVNAADSVLPSATKRRLISPDPVATPSPKTPRSTKKRNPTPRKEVHFQAHQQPQKIAMPNVPSDGVVPPWQNLPYEVLLLIFRYALYPTHDDDFRPTSNVNWLVRASRICKAFAEPALSALYESPPLMFRDQPHDFLDVIATPDTYFNYRLKVKRLELDARRTLAYSLPGRGSFEIGELLSHLPNVFSIDIISGLDRPPYRQLTQKGKWFYPENLFRSMADTGIRLKEWRWAGHMVGKLFPGFQELHLRTPFQSLTHLTLSHLWLLGENNTAGKGTPVILPTALSPLRNLESLTLVACHSEGWKILQNLEVHLKELAIIKCPTFDTTVLQPFLEERGRRLTQLILSHNHALDLRWLVDLKSSCPKLQILRMDLTYFSTALLTQNADAEPVFDTLLFPEDIPSWPTTLAELEMLNLRKWSPDAAVTFFESLVSSSAQLKHLKRLIIRAMIDISWRERAKFREKWIGTLTATFLRKSPAPNPHLASLRTFREWKAKTVRQDLEQREKEEATKSDSDRRVTRSFHAEQDPGSEAQSEGEIRQASCEIVEISIDNMRPTEIRLSEADFMDSEISGDEEWTGERSSPAQTTYAW